MSKLETAYERIERCEVVIERPHQRHRQGQRYHVRVTLAIPGPEGQCGPIANPIRAKAVRSNHERERAAGFMAFSLVPALCAHQCTAL